MKRKGIIKQSEKNRNYSRRNIIIVLIAMVAFIFSIVANENTKDKMEDQISLHENVIDLREGSQYLTSEVRSYASTGNRQYVNNYWEVE